MPTPVLIPKMGMTMKDGTLVEWLVPDGSEVRAGQPLFHMVTEKLDCDVEAETSGRLAHGVPPDTTLEPGGVVGWLLAPGEEAPAGVSGASPVGAAPRAGAAPALAGEAGPVSGDGQQQASQPGGRLLSSPNARRLARELGVDLARVRGTGPGGRITAEDVEAHAARPAEPVAAVGPATAAPSPPSPPSPRSPPSPPSPLGGRPAASPIARKLADRLGVDLASLTGSGPGGRITRQDVESAVRAGGAVASGTGAPAVATGTPRPGPRPGDRIRLVGMRGTIAARMHESLRTMAQLTLGMEVAADRLVALREQLRQDWSDDADRRLPSYTDFVLRAVASALGEHPLLNARVAENAVVLEGEIHLGLAVALDHGLVVPVIRSTDQLSLADIAVESARLSAAAREGRLGPDDLAGGTFSVTTLGAYDVDFFTPVINPPNVAILGVGRLRDGVAWDGDTPRRARQLTLSLTFDHRAVDGAPAAAFLAAVRDLLERPTRLLS